MSLEVEYIDSPVGAQGSGTTQTQGAQPFSDSVLENSSDIPFATFEGISINSYYSNHDLSIKSNKIESSYKNGNVSIISPYLESSYENGNVGIFVKDQYRAKMWPLDGTRHIMPDSPQNIGWWSKEMSDENGHFASNPKITITFPVPFSTTGLTFTFSPSTDQWCSELKISWYSKQTLIRESNVKPDGTRWILEELVEGFDRIVIEIIKTSKPKQFAKIQKIMIGQSIHFGRNEIISATTACEADHKLCELTVDTIKIEIHDRKKRKLLPQENQRVELYYKNKLVAVHYIKDSTREAPYFYTLQCQSAIGLLEDVFLGGMYDHIPLEILVKEIMGTVNYKISPHFNKTKVSGYLPVCTRREALQQVAFAIGSLVTTHGSDAIKLNPVQDVITGSFNGNQIFSGAKVTTEKRYAKVEVARHSYKKSTEVEELATDEYISGSNVLITFSDPHYDYTIKGGTITDSGVNWVKVTANGVVSISAKKYIHNVVMQSRRNQFATANEQHNVLTVDSATLVTADNVTDVLTRLYESSTLRSVLKEDAVIDNQTCGDHVSSLNPWGSQTRGFITAMSSTYTQGGHTASITIQGVEVETEGVYYYSGQLYSGDTNVIY